MNLREAAQQALEALEISHPDFRDKQLKAITALRVALAEPEQEPVAWMTHGNDSLPLFHRTRAGALAWGADPQPLYTAPPQRKPLTTQQILDLFDSHNVYGSKWVEFARAIERAHGIGGQE